MSDDLAQDEEYIELCRVAAWADSLDRERHWDSIVGQYIRPDAWPESVDPDAFVNTQIEQA